MIPEALEAFRELKVIRNKSIHFNFSTESSVKIDAIRAIQLVTTIIDKQFSSYYNNQPWYIPGIPGGVAFIKKEAEQIPFVLEVLIPNSELVGYKHKMVQSGNELVPEDNNLYKDIEITDEEFKNLYNQENN